MDDKEFLYLRKRLKKTQKEMAQLLGVSLKAIHSYEQGWRSIPIHVERQLLFLIFMKGPNKNQKPCWVIKKCSPESKKRCPAWEFQAGRFCWFINGTICHGIEQKNWREKMRICRTCEVLSLFLV
ncbi:MAG: two-CW domain-containing protein [Pseudomonadota bacterium]